MDDDDDAAFTPIRRTSMPERFSPVTDSGSPERPSIANQQHLQQQQQQPLQLPASAVAAAFPSHNQHEAPGSVQRGEARLQGVRAVLANPREVLAPRNPDTQRIQDMVLGAWPTGAVYRALPPRISPCQSLVPRRSRDPSAVLPSKRVTRQGHRRPPARRTRCRGQTQGAPISRAAPRGIGDPPFRSRAPGAAVQHALDALAQHLHHCAVLIAAGLVICQRPPVAGQLVRQAPLSSMWKLNPRATWLLSTCLDLEKQNICWPCSIACGIQRMFLEKAHRLN